MRPVGGPCPRADNTGNAAARQLPDARHLIFPAGCGRIQSAFALFVKDEKHELPGEDAAMATAVAVDRLSDVEHRKQLTRAVIAATVGTTIEWYDFFIYGTAAGLVFGKLYFPNQDAITATLLAFGTYFIGFVGRPIGAAIFGHYGDRIGRKATLIATLLCMGLATFAIAFVPTFASIGVWGAILLTILRAIQGIGVGGEWGGSVLLAMEWSRGHKSRGLVA